MTINTGFKDFSPGVLTSDDVDGYLMRQSIMVFATTAARDAALGSVLREGMHTYQSDSNQLTFYDGASWQIVGGSSGGSEMAFFMGGM